MSWKILASGYVPEYLDEERRLDDRGAWSFRTVVPEHYLSVARSGEVGNGLDRYESAIRALLAHRVVAGAP